LYLNKLNSLRFYLFSKILSLFKKTNKNPIYKNKHQKMLRSNFLSKVTYFLITVNILMVGLVMFNHYFTTRELNNLQKETQVLGVTNIPIFDSNYIMSDYTFESTRSFPTQQAVQQYLQTVNSPLKNYIDQGQSASYWIFNAARGVTSSKWGVVPQINPGVIIAYLEKEQSLISLSNYNTATDPENRIKTAMGYGCPDDAKCSAEYMGFANQLNWASYQLQFNFDRAKTGSDLVSPYHINKTITTLDNYNVFLGNAATAANYRYTPHVYWGNYNLWKIITAKGWGVSTQTYSYQEIDNINLPNSTKTGTPETKISLAEMLPILNKEFALGSQNQEISRLQTFLRQEGYFTYPQITGYYGSVTKTAHENYKRDKNLTSTPVVDACETLYSKVWKMGQTGEDVKQLQECLKKVGLFNWPNITGFYGNVTDSALKNLLQSKNKNSNPVASGTVQAASKGIVASGLNQRTEACGTKLRIVKWGSVGQKLEGPVAKNCLGNNFNWYKVDFGNGQIGWVVDTYLSDVASEAKKNDSISQFAVTNSRGHSASGLNLRSDVCGVKIGQIPWNQKISKLGAPVSKGCFGGDWDWYNVDYNGVRGWVVDFYLDIL
jgi:peptidoglycan hydrolase-like protein with peptidoglycan-binding domain